MLSVSWSYSHIIRANKQFSHRIAFVERIIMTSWVDGMRQKEKLFSWWRLIVINNMRELWQSTESFLFQRDNKYPDVQINLCSWKNEQRGNRIVLQCQQLFSSYKGLVSFMPGVEQFTKRYLSFNYVQSAHFFPSRFRLSNFLLGARRRNKTFNSLAEVLVIVLQMMVNYIFPEKKLRRKCVDVKAR